MKNQILLGANANHELIFGEYEITTRNGYKEFTASFDVVKPFNGDDYDSTSYYEDEVQSLEDAGCYHELYDLCKQFSCDPFELPDAMAITAGTDPRDTLDCSLFPECYEVSNKYYYFKSMECGQVDIEDRIEYYTNKRIYEIILTLWKKYHLKNVEGIKEFDDLIDELETNLKLRKQIGNADDMWIENYIKTFKVEIDNESNIYC